MEKIIESELKTNRMVIEQLQLKDRQKNSASRPRRVLCLQ